MKTVSLTQFGAVENLIDAEAEMPVIGPQDVLLRVCAFGFNPVDFQTRQVGFEALKAPVVLGFDVAGVIDEVGAEVRTFKRGDEVMAWLGGPSMAGGYAEYAAVPAAFVARKPPRLTFAEAASVPLAGLTAIRSLRRGRLDASKSLLVTGGAGGVGSWAILLAKALGAARIVTTCGSEASRAYIREHLGLKEDQIVNYPGLHRDGLAGAARDANDGRLYDIAMDCVGGSMTSLCCDVIEFEGSVISIVSGPKDSSHPKELVDEEMLYSRSAAFHFELVFAQTEYASGKSYETYTQQLAFLSELIANGSLALPKVTEIGDLSADTVRAAHRLLESGHTKGKLVAVVN